MDRIQCKSCGSESYNEYRKTQLHCGKCYETLQAQLDQQRKAIASTVKVLHKTTLWLDSERRKEFDAAVETLEALERSK